MRRRQQVTVEAVLGVLCMYLMIGLFFASIYSLIAKVNGDFFAQNLAATASRTLYFSFTTLTTVGYGDITPLHPLARNLANLEAIIGQLYPATLLARLVSLEIEHRRQSKSS